MPVVDRSSGYPAVGSYSYQCALLVVHTLRVRSLPSRVNRIHSAEEEVDELPHTPPRPDHKQKQCNQGQIEGGVVGLTRARQSFASASGLKRDHYHRHANEQKMPGTLRVHPQACRHLVANLDVGLSCVECVHSHTSRQRPLSLTWRDVRPDWSNNPLI